MAESHRKLAFESYEEHVEIPILAIMRIRK